MQNIWIGTLNPVTLAYQLQRTTMKKTINITPDKKITLATVKSFIKNNRDRLFVKTRSRFNGMTDGVDYIEGAKFTPATFTNSNLKNTLGLEGTWFVGQSRDYFRYYEDDRFVGVDVYNCCGGFYIVVEKTQPQPEPEPETKSEPEQQPVMTVNRESVDARINEHTSTLRELNFVMDYVRKCVDLPPHYETRLTSLVSEMIAETTDELDNIEKGLK